MDLQISFVLSFKARAKKLEAGMWMILGSQGTQTSCLPSMVSVGTLEVYDVISVEPGKAAMLRLSITDCAKSKCPCCTVQVSLLWQCSDMDLYIFTVYISLRNADDRDQYNYKLQETSNMMSDANSLEDCSQKGNET